MKAEGQLGLFEVGAEDPNVAWLESYLEGHGGWMTAGEIAVVAGRETGEAGRRWVRALAEASDWVLSGQRGYRHLKGASAEEVGRFVDWMESQGKKMIARAERVRRNGHRIFG